MPREVQTTHIENLQIGERIEGNVIILKPKNLSSCAELQEFMLLMISKEVRESIFSLSNRFFDVKSLI